MQTVDCKKSIFFSIFALAFGRNDSFLAVSPHNVKQIKKMKLHIFNPEHDIALAHNDKYFTAPHAGRQLRADCGFIPALWADDGDCVLVDDIESAEEHLRHIKSYCAKVDFITPAELHRLGSDVRIEPWGWDPALAFQLERAGVEHSCLPGGERLKDIRRLSSRTLSSEILKLIISHKDGLGVDVVGESRYVENISELRGIISDRPRSVLKSPWSSSGRGVRYVGHVLERPVENWVNNVIGLQGGIMVEPYYNKVADFGMEFIADAKGVHYRGLSVFTTTNGFYTGNLLASEDGKIRTMERFFTIGQLESVEELVRSLLSERLSGRYEGPLGVDMMVVANDDALLMNNKSLLKSEPHFLFHPMVEINLRRTMGHVAIDIAKRNHLSDGSLQIIYDGSHYHLRLQSGMSHS